MCICYIPVKFFNKSIATDIMTMPVKTNPHRKNLSCLSEKKNSHIMNKLAKKITTSVNVLVNIAISIGIRGKGGIATK